jgi:thiamine monophosphate synthase
MPEAEGNTIHMPGEDIDYSTMNRKELIALCKERGIVGMSAKKKEELIKILRGE